MWTTCTPLSSPPTGTPAPTRTSYTGPSSRPSDASTQRWCGTAGAAQVSCCQGCKAKGGGGAPLTHDGGMSQPLRCCVNVACAPCRCRPGQPPLHLHALEGAVFRARQRVPPHNRRFLLPRARQARRPGGWGGWRCSRPCTAGMHPDSAVPCMSDSTILQAFETMPPSPPPCIPRAQADGRHPGLLLRPGLLSGSAARPGGGACKPWRLCLPPL